MEINLYQVKRDLRNYFNDLKKNIKRKLFPATDPYGKIQRFNRRVGGLIKNILEDEYDTNSYSYSIQSLGVTKIIAKETKKEVKITVRLCRPGLLIGKGGRTIDMVTTRLTEYFGKPVTIHIEEDQLWYF